MKAKKTKITCYECGSSYSLDLSGLAPGVLNIKCMKCGKPVPILGRMLQSNARKGLKAGQEEGKPAEKKSSQSDYQGHSIHDFDETEEGMGGTAQSEEENSWLAIYGDMMSILLIFFVLLFAISSVDRKKFETVMQSVNHALGGNVQFSRVEPLPPGEEPPNPLEIFKVEVQTEKNALSELFQQLNRFIQENQLESKLSLLNENEGVVLIAQDMTMFDLGNAEIRENVLPSLKKIAGILSVIPNHIVVEGHTDDLPIHSGRFSSNWELSVMRATNVVHYLVTECGLDPKRLAAAGYACYRPRYGLATPDKEKNRRIEVVIKKKYADNLVDELLQPH